MRKLSTISLFAAACMVTIPAAAQDSDFESTAAAKDAPVVEAAPPPRAAPQTVSRPAPQPKSNSSTWAAPKAAPASSPATVTPPQCAAAQKRLTELQSQEEILWSTQTEADDLYRVWSSRTCVNARRGKSDIKEDLANAMLLLKSNGTDIDQELQAETAKCQNAAAAKWASETAAFRRQHTKSALAETCMLNMRLTLYGKALNRLNASNANSFANAQANYEAAQQARAEKIAADKAAYEASQAEWKRRVKLCNQGKTKYCASE